MPESPIRGLQIIVTDAGVIAADGHHVSGVPSGDFVQSLSAQSGSGVPDGGTTGQALVKASNADGDADWETISGGGDPVPDADGSTKGLIKLAGDLAGTAASPQIAAGAVGTTELAANAVTAAKVAADVATQAELDAVAAAAQPLDSDLTAIAALTTTSYGRALLALADAAAGRSVLGLGTAATQASGAFDASGAAAAAQAASQPLDSDLTAIAALTTTSFGRALLALSDAAAGRTALGLGTIATIALDTDGTLAADSDTRGASQKAVKTYVDSHAGGGAVVTQEGDTPPDAGDYSDGTLWIEVKS